MELEPNRARPTEWILEGQFAAETEDVHSVDEVVVQRLLRRSDVLVFAAQIQIQLLASDQRMGNLQADVSGVPIGLAMLRVLPNAAALGTRADSAAVQAALARSICWDHIFCTVAISAFIALQLRVACDHGNALRSEPQAGEARAQ